MFYMLCQFAIFGLRTEQNQPNLQGFGWQGSTRVRLFFIGLQTQFGCFQNDEGH